VILLLLSSSRQTFAVTTLVDSNGFESPWNGPLEDQPGWASNNFGNGTSTATVESGFPYTGDNSLRVFRDADSDARWADPIENSSNQVGRYIVIDWDMLVVATGPTDGFGPFFGVEAYDDSSSVNLLGSLGVDATTGEVLYQKDGSGEFLVADTTITPNSWNHYQIRLDFQTDAYQISVNYDDVLNSLEGFVDGPSSQLTDADIAALAAGPEFDSQNKTATAYFDNFIVRELARSDFDFDLDVDDDDLDTWVDTFGSATGGDADHDGDADGSDFLIWQREFDSGTPPVGATIAQVPEPSTLVLAMFLIMCRGISGPPCLSRN